MPVVLRVLGERLTPDDEMRRMVFMRDITDVLTAIRVSLQRGKSQHGAEGEKELKQLNQARRSKARLGK